MRVCGPGINMRVYSIHMYLRIEADKHVAKMTKRTAYIKRAWEVGKGVNAKTERKDKQLPILPNGWTLITHKNASGTATTKQQPPKVPLIKWSRPGRGWRGRTVRMRDAI